MNCKLCLIEFLVCSIRILYLAATVFICLSVCTVCAVILFPRSVSLKLGDAKAGNITMPPGNHSKPSIIINVSEVLFVSCGSCDYLNKLGKVCLGLNDPSSAVLIFGVHYIKLRRVLLSPPEWEFVSPSQDNLPPSPFS